MLAINIVYNVEIRTSFRNDVGPGKQKENDKMLRGREREIFSIFEHSIYELLYYNMRFEL